MTRDTRHNIHGLMRLHTPSRLCLLLQRRPLRRPSWWPRHRPRHRLNHAYSAALIALTLWLLPALAGGAIVLAAPASRARTLPPDTSCAHLAQADPTATNGTLWGTTILPGLGQRGGWFGVPVCANGVNQVDPGGANVSCNRLPDSDAAPGACAPGAATSDGYGLTFQCVELVARFAAWAFGDAPSAWRGDAPYLWLSGHHPTDFSASANGGARPPQPGDILVWGTLDSQGHPWPAGPAGGHVAVVAAVGDGRITFVEENMLGHSDGVASNIPSETTSLTQSVSGQWTIGPTDGTNGGRALYGWLHSARNTGHFTHTGSSGANTASTPPAQPGASPTTAPTTAPAAPAEAPASETPSLARGVVITGAGTLAEVVWSDSQTPTPASAAPPHAVVESLGAPPGASLAPDQPPAVVSLPTGERYIFARGEQGALYAAYTPANQPGVFWQALGTPPDVTLTGSVTAQWDSAGMLVGALGSDGAFWLRAGPAGMLGDWVSLGRPTSAALQGTPILVTASAPAAAPTATSGAVANAPTPPTASPSSTSTSMTTAPADVVMRQALAIGSNGTLYEDTWRADALAPGWSGWQPAPLAGVTQPLLGALLSVSPSVSPSVSQQGQAEAQEPTQAGDALVASDRAGAWWLLSRSGMPQPWTATLLPMPAATSAVLAATIIAAVPATSAAGADKASPSAPQSSLSGALQVYATETQTSGATPAPTPAPTSTASPASSPASSPRSINQAAHSAQAAPAAQGAQDIVEESFSLSAASGGAATLVGAWAPLGGLAATPSVPPAQPAEAATAAPMPANQHGSSAALDLGTHGSALLFTQGNVVAALGDQQVERLLAPSLAAGGLSSSPAAELSQPLVLGAVAGPSSFSDSFVGDTLDPRWALIGAPSDAAASSTSARVEQGALTLAAPTTAMTDAVNADAGLVAAAQGAPSGDLSVSVRVTPGADWSRSDVAEGGAQAGLLLTLDDWNRVTLALRANGTVALCARTAGSEPQCSVAPLPSGISSGQGVYVRVSQEGATLTGGVSADGVHWAPVGVWSVAWLPNSGASTASPGPYAPPTSLITPTAADAGAWLRFTSIGMYVEAASAPAASSGQSSAQFSDFQIGAA